MGIKGDRLTQQAAVTADLVVHKLAAINNITSKKMFGGFGIFQEGKMFGIIDSKGQVYFKVNDTTKAGYEAKNAAPHSKMPYYSIPEEVFADARQLVLWAKKSIAISK